jgi:hypothetical protein
MRQTLASLTAKLDAYKDSERRAPMHARMTARMIPFMHDEADHFAEHTVDETLRFVAFGFDTRYSIDVVIAQIGTGAGEGVLNTETNDVDSLIARADGLPFGGEYAMAMKTLASEFRRWLVFESRSCFPKVGGQ